MSGDPFGVLPQQVFDDVQTAYRDILQACLRADVSAFHRLTDPLLHEHGYGGAYAVAAALAIAVIHSCGLDKIQQRLVPGVGAVVNVALPTVVLFGDGYRSRVDAARDFVSSHLRGHDARNLIAIRNDPDHRILHGLCECLAALRAA